MRSAPDPSGPLRPVAGPDSDHTTSVTLDDLARVLRARRPETLVAAAQDQAAAGAQPLPAHVLARLPAAQEAALANAKLIERQRIAARGHELHQVLAARATEPRIGPKERVRRLRRLYDAWAQHVRPHSACRRGCSHCCHIGVAVSRTEAELIAEETRVPLRSQSTGDSTQGAPLPASGFAFLEATQQAADDLAHNPRPCTFLSEQGRCRIYASRPLACRQLHNLDADELLCQIVPGAAIPAPYADASELDLLAVMALRDPQMADIRAWFGERGTRASSSP